MANFNKWFPGDRYSMAPQWCWPRVAIAVFGWESTQRGCGGSRTERLKGSRRKTVWAATRNVLSIKIRTVLCGSVRLEADLTPSATAYSRDLRPRTGCSAIMSHISTTTVMDFCGSAPPRESVESQKESFMILPPGKYGLWIRLITDWRMGCEAHSARQVFPWEAVERAPAMDVSGF